MKNRSLKIVWPFAVVLLIVALQLSCDHASPEYVIVPVTPPERFKDMVPLEATVERIDIGLKTNNSVMIFLRTAAGDRRVIVVGPPPTAEMIGFARALRTGESYAFPKAFLEYQQRNAPKQ